MEVTNDMTTGRVALSMLPGIDTTVASRLMDIIGSPIDIINATEAEMKCIPDIPRSIIPTQTRYASLERARREVEFLSNSEVKALWFEDDDYPHRLLNARRPPLVVYTLGNTDLNNSLIVGIVGTRHATTYGTSTTHQLVEGLSKRLKNVVTVSGLAYGIDIAAHEASLANGIPTIGIVGHGMTRLYPAAHRDTAARMVRNGGMILSDYPHDANVSGHNFLERNRLVAALCHALIVVESADKGGALSTANCALNSGTQLFAVPGRLTDNYSVGCNNLIASGTAKCLTSVDSLIESMQWPTINHEAKDHTKDATTLLTDQLTTDEKQLLRLILTTENCDNDIMVSFTSMPISKVMTILIGLEMRGIVAIKPGNRYQILKTIDPNSLLT